MEVHGGHGYLIAQFMPRTRTSVRQYGGNLRNRMRLPLEIIANIRTKCGDDFPIQFRISGRPDRCPGAEPSRTPRRR